MRAKGAVAVAAGRTGKTRELARAEAEVAGIDVSTYGVEHTMESVKSFVQVADAAEALRLLVGGDPAQAAALREALAERAEALDERERDIAARELALAERERLGDRLAAKGSPKVAKEHQQQRALLRERMNGLAALRTVSFQQLWINSFCLEHRCLHLY